MKKVPAYVKVIVQAETSEREFTGQFGLEDLHNHAQIREYMAAVAEGIIEKIVEKFGEPPKPNLADVKADPELARFADQDVLDAMNQC